MAIDATSMRTRRALLFGTVGGAIALVAGALGRPLAGRATDGDVIHVGDDLSGTDTTRITTSALHGLDVITSDSEGLEGFGLASDLSRLGCGVSGWSDRTDGYGVVGYAGATAGYACGVGGLTDGPEGIGVNGWATATTGATTGVHGSSDSTDGTGVSGFAGASVGATVGVKGQSNSHEGAGVRGVGLAGRGGVFSGPIAQIRLEPATTAHPASGQMGDVFLDNEGALWFCKGDTNWRQIA